MSRVAAACLIAVALGLAPFSLQPVVAYQENTAQIAYLMDDDLHLIHLDGSGDIQLTDTFEVNETRPAWSPDGRYLLFYRSIPAKAGQTAQDIQNGIQRSGSYVIDFMTGTTERVDIPLWAGYVAGWSPDSAKFIVIGASDSNAKRNIYTMNTDGGDLQALTDGMLDYFVPSWSPDGHYIAYVSGLQNGTLHVVRADGTADKALTTDQDVSMDFQPKWSPDSKQITFTVLGVRAGATSTQLGEIYLVNADGSDLHPLTHIGGTSLDPQWSPDGQQIVFTSFKAGAFDLPYKDPLLTDIFRIHIDGSDLVNLTHSEGIDGGPEWSTDGHWIAFSSERPWNNSPGHRPGIFIMRPDGSDVRMVTNLPAASPTQSRWAGAPVWRPIPHP